MEQRPLRVPRSLKAGPVRPPRALPVWNEPEHVAGAGRHPGPDARIRSDGEVSRSRSSSRETAPFSPIQQRGRKSAPLLLFVPCISGPLLAVGRRQQDASVARRLGSGSTPIAPSRGSCSRSEAKAMGTPVGRSETAPDSPLHNSPQRSPRVLVSVLKAAAKTLVVQGSQSGPPASLICSTDNRPPRRGRPAHADASPPHRHGPNQVGLYAPCFSRFPMEVISCKA